MSAYLHCSTTDEYVYRSCHRTRPAGTRFGVADTGIGGSAAGKKKKNTIGEARKKRLYPEENVFTSKLCIELCSGCAAGDALSCTSTAG